jgi:catechol 2,3-dioxygenase-like lactoylglutathione lyase family enzyme
MTLGSARIGAFVATTDAARAIRFYRDTLGLRLVLDDRFALIFDANGTSLRIQKVASFTPQPFTALGWEVDDITAAIEGLVARGVTMGRFDGMAQDERGVWTTENGDRIAWFRDPDGNMLSLAQYAGGHRPPT